ncbi:MAG: hypothetical protein E7160_04675 [Firmicutes bacterium]|nr:hypothetical protein [Bacillota bacterium]
MKKISKIFAYMFLTLVLFTGCGNMENTPTKKVEELLGKYQSMDSEVLTQLDSVISSDTNMSDSQKKEYRSLLEKQYQNLSYKITDENIEGDSATVDVEIEVLDYATNISESKKYYMEHKDEFKNNDKNDYSDNDSLVEDAKDAIDDVSDGLDNVATFIDYKIKQMKTVNDKVKYTITFNLTKENGKWQVEDLSDIDRQKIHGLYGV